MSEDWRSRNRAGETQAKNEFKQHMADAETYVRRRDEFESAESSRPAQEKKRPTTVIAGQKMQVRNAEKSFTYVGGYRQGGAQVSKKAMATQGPKAVTAALKGQMVSPKKLRIGASNYDAEHGTPKRMQTEAYIHGVKSGQTGQSLWTTHKRSATKS